MRGRSGSYESFRRCSQEPVGNRGCLLSTKHWFHCNGDAMTPPGQCNRPRHAWGHGGAKARNIDRAGTPEAEPRGCLNAPGLVVRLSQVSQVCLPHILGANRCLSPSDSPQKLDSLNIRQSLRPPRPGRCLTVPVRGPENLDVRRQNYIVELPRDHWRGSGINPFISNSLT
jgi:hypothetical protein